VNSATLAAVSITLTQRLTGHPVWKVLEAHCATIRNLHLRQI